MMKRLGFLSDIKEVIDKLPSEELLIRLLDQLPDLREVITRLPEPETLERLGRLSTLADAMGNGTIDRLLAFLPLLQNLPTNEVLVDIANMKPYLASMPTREELKSLSERLPSPQQFDELITLLGEMQGFLEALKG